MDAEFLILGAGPAGLGAAFRLARAGRSVIVLERAERVGGLAASFEVAGLRVDHGSHRLHPSTPPPILAALRDLLGDDLQVRPRRGRMLVADRLVGFPPRLGELLRRLPPALSARLALDAAASPLRRARDGTFAEAVRATLGPTLGDHFYFPYVRKLFGAVPEQLDAELARRRIARASPLAIARRALQRGEPTFFYPRRGFGQICEALAEAAAAAGAEIRTGAEVVSLGTDGDRVDAGLGDGTVVRGARAWSTLPLPHLARLAAAPAYVSDAGDRLEHRALVLVYLVLEASHWTSYDAHYFPDPGVPMSRVSEPKNYRDSGDDPDAVTVLCAEVPCRLGDATWQASADQLGASVVEGLGRVGLPEARPAQVEVRRVAHAYPVYRLGFGEAFEHLDGWAARLPGLLTLGRQGLFAHDNTHHALAQAWAAADALRPDGSVDPAAWSEARARFRAHVVED